MDRESSVAFRDRDRQLLAAIEGPGARARSEKRVPMGAKQSGEAD
jgi:hypothetical protein